MRLREKHTYLKELKVSFPNICPGKSHNVVAYHTKLVRKTFGCRYLMKILSFVYFVEFRNASHYPKCIEQPGDFAR